jgi:hypothetical protein
MEAGLDARGERDPAEVELVDGKWTEASERAFAHLQG